MDGVGYYILDLYSMHDKFNSIQAMFKEHGVLAVGVAGFTPIPYKVFTIASGVFNFSLYKFILVSIISRGLRFYIVSFLLLKFGDKAKIFIDKYFAWLTIGFVILLLGSYVLIKFII